MAKIIPHIQPKLIHNCFSENNIIHEILSAEKLIYSPAEISNTYLALNNIFQKIKTDNLKTYLSKIYNFSNALKEFQLNIIIGPTGPMTMTQGLTGNIKNINGQIIALLTYIFSQELNWDAHLTYDPKYNYYLHNQEDNSYYPFLLKEYHLLPISSGLTTNRADQNIIMGLIYYALAFQAKDSNLKITLAEKSLTLNPHQTSAYIERAKGFLLQKKYSQAIGNYQYAVGIKPDCLEWISELAEIFQNLGYYPEALDLCNKLLEKEPVNNEWLEKRIKLYLHFKRYSEALSAYNQLIKNNPTNIIYYFERAKILFSRESFSEALLDCQTIIALNPNFAPAHRLRNEILELIK